MTIGTWLLVGASLLASSVVEGKTFEAEEVSAGTIAAVVIVLGILLFITIILLKNIVIERLGRFHRVLNAGINFCVPFIDQPRAFQWRKTSIRMDNTPTYVYGYGGHGSYSNSAQYSSSRISDELVTSFRIDLRESVFNFLPQEVYTKDTVLLDVNALMYYSIYDVKKAIYEVDDLQSALSNTAQTQLKEVFGNLLFTEALESQNRINEHLAMEFGKLFYSWGIEVHRMELLDLSPKHNVQEQMKKQMVAERERRGDFIRSEGKKAELRLKAEGTRMVSVNMGLAHQEATRKESEGESGARVEIARAESTTLELVGTALRPDGASQSQYLIAHKYIDLFNKAARATDVQLYLPYLAFDSIAGLVGQLSDSLSSEKPKKKKAIDDAHAEAAAAKITSSLETMLKGGSALPSAPVLMSTEKELQRKVNVNVDDDFGDLE